MTEWYLWEKSPGTIGVLPVSRLKDHADRLVMKVDGTLEEAIKQAELCEKEGYSVISEEMPGQRECRAETEKAGILSEVAADDEAVEGYVLPDFLSPEDFTGDGRSGRRESAFVAKKKEEKKKASQADTWELEGQLSFDFVNM